MALKSKGYGSGDQHMRGMMDLASPPAFGLFSPTKEEAHARWSDPETSHAAADSVEVTRGQAIVLAAFERLRQATDETLCEYLAAMDSSISPSGARSRRAELVACGAIIFTGRQVRLKSGRMARVWALA